MLVFLEFTCATLNWLTKVTSCFHDLGFYADGSQLLINTIFACWTTQSGAKINITDGSSPERIVTVLGPHQTIIKVRKNSGDLKNMTKKEKI